MARTSRNKEDRSCCEILANSNEQLPIVFKSSIFFLFLNMSDEFGSKIMVDAYNVNVVCKYWKFPLLSVPII